jgi:threonine dehydrogenase-like Zn-dependent dehydrogenase
MKALVWCAPYKVNVETVPDPRILNPRDAIIRITSTCICGSDLHLVDGFIPFMKPGDILGHEPMGEVVELGPGVDQNKVKVGDRVIVPFLIGCGECFFCKRGDWSCCDNTNPNAPMAQKMFGHATAGVFGYSHLTGGYAGGQAEFLRVPLADVNCQVMPKDLDDHQLVFLTDIFPTGYMAAENANIQPDDTVAVWGCGPVGQFTIASALLLGAGRVIAIDDGKSVPRRLQMARDAGALTIDTSTEDVYERLMELTGGIGPDSCIDAVGMEAHGTGFLDGLYDKVKTNLMPRGDPPDDSLLPQRGHDQHARRLRGLCGQDPDGSVHEQGPDPEDRPDPCAQICSETARPRAQRQDRPDVRRHPSPPAEPGV